MLGNLLDHHVHDTQLCTHSMPYNLLALLSIAS